MFGSPRSRSIVSLGHGDQDGEVAAEEIAVGAGGLRVLQHLLERDQVPVDVVKDGEHA